MASGDDNAASKAGHMAAPTTKCIAQMPLANGEPSTHGAIAPVRSQRPPSTSRTARSDGRRNSGQVLHAQAPSRAVHRRALAITRSIAAITALGWSSWMK